MISNSHVSCRHAAALIASSALISLPYAHAAPGADATATDGALSEVVVSAPYSTPTSTPLEALEPTTVISQEFIREHIPPSANYDSIVSFAPGVQVTGTAGAGSARTKIAIRGFTDGQYNITVDGIPLQFQNLTHSTLAYFVSSDFDQVELDKGPGTSSSVGLATFGGTIAMQTRKSSNVGNIAPYAGVGSYDTHFEGVKADTGPITALNGGGVLMDAEHLDGGSYTTESHVDRANYLIKYEQPLSDQSHLTLLADYNVAHLNLGVGASKADIARHGYEYELSSNPQQPNYFGYNRDAYVNDFEYVGLGTELGGGWSLDTKLYTYAFGEPHQFAANDVTGLTHGTALGPLNIGGAFSSDAVRNFGEIINLTDTLRWGDLKSGVWYDHQSYHRFSEKYDFTLGQVIPKSVSYDNTGYLSTVQPYVQVDLNMLDRLKATVGAKYDNFNLGLDAPVNSANGLPLYGATAHYDKVLPGAALNYRFRDDAAAYVQVAQAMVVPPPNNALYVVNPSLNSIKPQTTMNYQAGMTWQRAGLSVNADGFFIRAQNLIQSTRSAGNLVVFFSAGDATYKGFEGELTKTVVEGLDLYANGFVESAKNDQTGQWVPEAPNATAAAGVTFHRAGIYGSLLDKWVGQRYALVNQAQFLAPYNELDLSLSYTWQGPWSLLGPIAARLEVNNLLNSVKIDDYVGTSGGSSTPLYLVQGGRNFTLTLSVPLGDFHAQH